MSLAPLVNPDEPDPQQCDNCMRLLAPRMPVITDRTVSGEPERVVAWLCIVCMVHFAVARALEPAR